MLENRKICGKRRSRFRAAAIENQME